MSVEKISWSITAPSGNQTWVARFTVQQIAVDSNFVQNSIYSYIVEKISNYLEWLAD
jgi:hypothetical protein